MAYKHLFKGGIVMKNVGCDFRNTVYRMKQKGKEVGRWVSDHKAGVITAGIIIAPIVAKVAVSAISYNKSKMEMTRRKCDKYDPRTGEHYFIKKPLSKSQQLELERRYRLGESKGEILRDMGTF